MVLPLVGIGLVVVMIAAVGASSALSDSLSDLFKGALTTVQEGPGRALEASRTVTLPSGQAATMALTTDALVMAVAGTDSTEVSSMPFSGSAVTWKTTVPVASGDMTLRVLGDLVVLDAERVASRDNKTMRAVLDRATGAQKWLDTWADLTDVAYLGTHVLVQRANSTRTRLGRVDLTTGKTVWMRPDVDDMYIIEERVSQPVLVARGSSANATGVPAPLADAFDLAYPLPLAVDATVAVEMHESDRHMEVVNPADGTRRAAGTVPLASDQWRVLSGMIVGERSDVSTSLSAYRLSDLGLAWEYRIPAGASFDSLRPCSAQALCVSMSLSDSSDVLVAVDVATGAEMWKRTVEAIGDLQWNPVGDRVVVGGGGFTTLTEAVLLDARTGAVVSDFGSVGTRPSVIAASGGTVALGHFGLAGGGGRWSITLVDSAKGSVIGTGKLGSKTIKDVLLSQNAAVVRTDDSTIRVFLLPG